MSTSFYQRNVIRKLLILLTIISVSSCGGGTTGTSSTGELKLQGKAERISGRPLMQAEMLVYSATSGQELLASRTDSQGNFAMNLPGSEASVLLEIEGERTPPLVRKFTESSVLTTVIVKQSEPNDSPSAGQPGTPARRFFDVQYTFELHINDRTLCNSLTTVDNQIFIKEPIESEQCTVEIEAFSNELANETFYAQLIGICDGDTMPLSISRATSAGVMTVDIAEAYKRGCRSLRISAYSVQTSDTRIVFPINEELNEKP